MIKIIAIGIVFGMGAVWLVQLLLLPIALKATQRKTIAPSVCWLFLVPYVGIVVAYWIACAKEPT